MENCGIFDTHVHLDDEKFDIDREELIRALPSFGVTRLVNVGANLVTSKNSVELSEKFDYIYASVGVHPSDTSELSENGIEILRNYVRDCKKVVAIGEIGLDYHYENTDRDTQKFWFKRQMEIANELNLPVILHLRDAFEDALEIMKYFGKMHKNGVVHCFSGSPEFAREALKLGYKIGVGGVVTFSNAKKLVSVVNEVSINDILIETDCPYMAPTPHRGERNDPSLTRFVAEKIAQIKCMDINEVIKITYENGNRLFGI